MDIPSNSELLILAKAIRGNHPQTPLLTRLSCFFHECCYIDGKYCFEVMKEYDDSLSTHDVWNYFNTFTYQGYNNDRSISPTA